MLSVVVVVALGASAPQTPLGGPAGTWSHKPSRRRDGAGLMITGGLGGASVLISRVFFTVLMGNAVRCADGIDLECDPARDDYSGFGGLGVFGGYTTMPGFALAYGLLGGGLARHGRTAAIRDLPGHRRARSSTRTRRIVGWTLLGVGAATWAVVLPTAYGACSAAMCFVATHEAGFYAGAALLGAGVGLAPYARGYERQARAQRVADTLAVGPTVARRSAGVALSGKF